MSNKPFHPQEVGVMTHTYEEGISTRDWFAGMAMQGMLSNISDDAPSVREEFEAISILSIRMANMMIKALDDSNIGILLIHSLSTKDNLIGTEHSDYSEIVKEFAYSVIKLFPVELSAMKRRSICLLP